MSDTNDKAVIVFVFPEPEGAVELGLIIEESKLLFAGKKDVRIYAGIRKPAQKVIDIFNELEIEDDNLVKHAKSELERIANDEDFNEAIIEAVRGFCKYGHSGGSASVAIPMLNDLLQFKNLTPLTNDASEWNEVGTDMWQSTRNSEAFSNDRGNTYYLLSEGADQTNPSPLHISEKIDG